jgi:predicted dehydrogenase
MINVAVAGYGWWGEHIARRLAGNEALTVKAVVEPDAQRLEKVRAAGFAGARELDEVLSDPAIDAVILTTPGRLHEAQVVAAAGAGKHVFCEKPLALSSVGAACAVAACASAGVILGIGHERRFEPSLAHLKELIDGGDLGVIMHAEAAFSHDKLVNVPVGDWRTRKADSPGAGMTAMGIHLSDLMIWMFGRVATVQALTADRVLGWETGDVVSVQLRFEAGMSATFSAILATPAFVRFHVFGADKWAEIRYADHPDTPGTQATLACAQSGKPPVIEHYDWTDTVVANLEAFAAAIDGRRAYPFTAGQLVHNIEVLEAIAAAAERGETVHLKS